MDPSIAATIATGLGAPHATELLLELTKRVAAAKAERGRTDTLAGDPSFPGQRRELMAWLCDLQGEAMLTISDQALLERLVPLLLAQAATIYEADTEQEFEAIRLALKRVGGAIAQYKQRMAERARVRTTAVFVTILSLWGLGAVAAAGPYFGWSETTTIPIFSVPLPVLLWSAVGSFAAMLYRFNASGDIELQDPLRWMFTRPLTGIVIGTVTFLIIKAGFMTTNGTPPPNLGSNSLVWLVAFLAGFSDRFADTLLQSLVGRFGGSASGPLVSVQSASGPPAWGTVGTWLDQLGKATLGKVEERPANQGQLIKADSTSLPRDGGDGADTSPERLKDVHADQPVPARESDRMGKRE